MEQKVNQQGNISQKRNGTLKRACCRIIEEPGIHGIAFGFPWCWGVFGSLSHFRRSSGAVPPWALYRWAHVWRNEPRAIILPFSLPPPCLCVCRLALCLPLSASPSFLISVPSSSPPLIISPYPSCIFFLHPPSIALPSLPLFSSPPLAPHIPYSPRGDCVLGLRSLESVPRQWGDSAGGPGERNELTETQEPISGLCYRKICPFTLRRTARRALEGGMRRCCRRNTQPLLFVLVESLIPVATVQSGGLNHPD
ncbi:hypothetical protein CesoFtcFv8_027876 [Champsocephalus esox]|uniref:Uncharacterized protein n=1 Tax=Champsocephalus esox TaxID=159716 RepID=A0AAN8AZ86_9TELE|nr:hypothetical protein CesoFtcFv8_027876 [Champsocephalus esox]